MNNTTNKKNTRLKTFLNILIVLMVVVVIVLFGSFVNQMFFTEQIDSTVFQRNDGVETEKRIQISILNACDVNGLASNAKMYLFRRNFDVLDVGNYDSIVSMSFIIDRVGNTLASGKVASAMGIADSLIITEIDSSLYLMNTVVIGKDYRELKPFK